MVHYVTVGLGKLAPSKNLPALKVVAQDGTPLPPEHLISSVNLRVEVEGTEFGDTFRLLAMRKLESPPLA